MHDYLAAFVGGGMIGLAAVMLMATQGRILGVSGILSQLLPPMAKDWPFRVAFIAGILIAPLLTTLLFGSMPAIQLDAALPLIIIGGFLVGLGTVFGSGCTSGHGVCGLPRLSPRSIAATCVFMGTAGLTVYLLRHVFGGTV